MGWDLPYFTGKIRQHFHFIPRGNDRAKATSLLSVAVQTQIGECKIKHLMLQSRYLQNAAVKVTELHSGS